MYQTKITKEKQDAVNNVLEYIKGKKNVLFTDFRGLSVEEITNLRNRMNETDSTFRVIKNNYAKIAFKEAGFPEVDELFIGPTAISVNDMDAGPVSKILFEFQKKTTVKVKGGIVNGKVYTIEELESVSKLPGKDQLIAMLMSTMNAPLQNFVYVLNGVTTKLVRTLKAVADKKQS
jgi:large subunit ribosomal protein L10